VGSEFWHSLRELLQTIERSLALWCLLELGFATECLQRLLPSSLEKETENITAHELDQDVDPVQQKAMWGTWLGREEEFYLRCAHLVDPLIWPQILTICGPDVGARAQLLVEKYKDLLSSEIPDRLVAGGFKLVQISETSVNVLSYSDFDPMKMNRALYEALPFFAGRRLEEARQKIHAEKGISVSLAIVRQLVDRRILVADRSPGVDR